MPANKRSYAAGQLPAFPVVDAPSAAFGINRPGYVAKRGARIAFGQTRLEMRMLCAFGQFVDSAALFSEFCQCIIHWSACLPSAYKGCDRHWFCRLSTFPHYAAFAAFLLSRITPRLPPFYFPALRRVCRLSTFPHYAAFAAFLLSRITPRLPPFYFPALRRVCRLSTFPHYAAFAGFEAEKATTGIKPKLRNGQTSKTLFQQGIFVIIGRITNIMVIRAFL